MHPLLHVWWGLIVLAVVALVVCRSRFAETAAVAAVDDPETVEIPPDLVGLALLQSEPWAQDDLLKVCRQRYGQLRDWNQVRVAMGVGTVG